MNKKIVMPAALALCAALLFGSAKATAYAAQKKQDDRERSRTIKKPASEEDNSTVVGSIEL